MGQLFLVRHGQASFGADDYDQLSDVGREQSSVVGQALSARGVTPSAIIVGSLRRHRQTAEAAAASAGWDLPIKEDPGWDELDHEAILAAYTGMPFQEILAEGAREPEPERAFQKLYVEATAAWAADALPQPSQRANHVALEHFSQFRERVEAAHARALEALAAGSQAVVFTSGGSIGWAANSLLSGTIELWQRLNLVAINTGVTTVVTGRSGAHLVSFNEHGHLTSDRITSR